MNNSYENLEKKFHKLTNLNNVCATLQWDMAVNMPKFGEEQRVEQLTLLSEEKHKIISNNKIADEITNASTNNNLDDWQQANLRLMKKRYMHENALDEKLASKFSRVAAETECLWQDLKPKNDYKNFQPKFQELIEIVRDVAAAKSEKLQMGQYESLVDLYDDGRKIADINTVFTKLKNFLPDFIDEVLEFQSQIKYKNLEGPFPENLQKELGMEVMKLLGFNFDRGRLDESSHPFCGGYTDDIRITTRYREDEFITSLMGIVHETGHSIYENNLPKKWRYQPVGSSLGMSIHESQSLFYEMQCMRSTEFMSYITPWINKKFKTNYSWKEIYQQQIKVDRSFIRVDADELTYPLHVILRYELEKEIIENNLNAKDIPEKWNHLMEKYLKVKPSNYQEGCMQDVHWPSGIFGYFPCYTLGAVIASNYTASILEEKNIFEDLKNGNFEYINNWMKEKIHSQGSKYPADELLKQVNGSAIDVDIYIEHLKKRYLSEDYV